MKSSLVSAFPEVVKENIALAPFTSLQLGGPARYFAEPGDEATLIELVRRCNQDNVTVRILGGGSNLLIRESGFDGMVIRLIAPAFCQLRHADTEVTSGGGTKLSYLINYCVAAGLGGLEHLVGIPGTVGGALHGNSSTDDGDIGQVVKGARLLQKSGEVISTSSSQLTFSYRRSSLDELCILDATFKLNPDDARKLTKREQTFWILKRSRQPNFPVRASVAFIDPVGTTAASLIQQSGMTGSIEGAVQLSSNFPNYLIAGPSTTSDQVIRLLEKIRAAVLDRTGVSLLPHVQVW